MDEQGINMKYFHFFIFITVLLITACSASMVTQKDLLIKNGEENVEQFTVMDSLGRELKFAKLPERIIVAGKATTLLLDSLFLFPEAKTRILAIENRSQNASNFLSLVDPLISEKMILPKDVSIEEIASKNPDLIILKQSMVEKLGDPLSNLGFTVFYVNMETPQDFLKEIQSLGTIFGNRKHGSEINIYYQRQISEITDKLGDLDSQAKPTVLLIQATDQEGTISFSVPPASWLQTSMVELAGGRPIWKDSMLGNGWETITFEQIAVWNPDLIFIINYSGESREIVENLKGEDLWLELSAVQNDMLIPFGEDYISWDQPDSRWILGLQFLAYKIHPDSFEVNFIFEKAELFFSDMYELSGEQIENQIMPLIK